MTRKDYDKYANKPKGETKKAYRDRMRAEKGGQWWRPPPPPVDDYGHGENYIRSKTGAPLYAPVPASYEFYRTLPRPKGWPKPQQAHDLNDAREMPSGAVVYMALEWVWAMVLVPDGNGWWAYSVDPQERCGEGRIAVAPVFSSKRFPSKAALMKALRGPKGEWAVGG